MKRFIGNYKRAKEPELFENMPSEILWIVVESIEPVEDIVNYDQYRLHIGQSGLYDNNYIIATNDTINFAVYHNHNFIANVRALNRESLGRAIVCCLAQALVIENNISSYIYRREHSHEENANFEKS